MPSERKQLNVRIDAATDDLIERLRPAVSAGIGLDVSLAELVKLGMLELAKKYPPAPATQSPEGVPQPVKRGRGRPQKNRPA